MSLALICLFGHGFSMVFRIALICLSMSALPAKACQVALMLAIDVSQSIDVGEYNIQTQGIAEAVLAPDVSEALILGQVALSVVQWSGPEDQELSIPWTRIRTEDDLKRFSTRARFMPRSFVMSNTAVGQLIRFGLDQFEQVQDCARQVIDISGDGNDNAATGPEHARRQSELNGVEINALAIEWMGNSVTNFYRRSVVTQGGFVMTARGHEAYADTLRRKILKEVSQALF